MACQRHTQRKRKDCPECQKDLATVEIKEVPKIEQKVINSKHKKVQECNDDVKEIVQEVKKIEQKEEERKITLEEAIKVLGSKADEILKEIFEKKLLEAKFIIEKELSIQWEHLFLSEEKYSSAVLKNLEAEGWAMQFYSYPLAKNGIIPGPREHFTFKRLKRTTNKPVPDFDDPKVSKKYSIFNTGSTGPR